MYFSVALDIMEMAQSVKSDSVHEFNEIFLYFHLEHDIKYYNSKASKECVNVEVKKKIHARLSEHILFGVQKH
jgi:hypothetical protein